MSELKSCPFCGRTDSLELTTKGFWRVHCDVCEVYGPTTIDKKKAIEAWNRRAGDGT